MPHTHLDAVSAKFSAAGTPSYLLIPVPGIPGSQPLAPPQGEVSRHPNGPSSCHSRQQAEQTTALPREREGPPAQSCLGDQAGKHQLLQSDHSHTQLSDRSHLSDPEAELSAGKIVKEHFSSPLASWDIIQVHSGLFLRRY